MTENFDSYNAPQFFDFNKDLNREDNVDAYFEVDHENQEDPLICRFSENKEEIEFKNENRKPRRSMSTGNLILFSEMESLSQESHTDVRHDSCSLEHNSGQADYNLKYKSNSSLETTCSTKLIKENKTSFTGKNTFHLKRFSSRDNLNRLAQPKYHNGSAQTLNQDNYVSMAEAVRRFQVGTPTRFRTKLKPEVQNGAIIGKVHPTVPMSPDLLTKRRYRPVQAISYEEQKKLEYEEAQRYKIKAHPVNKKILQGPLKPVPIQKKPTTIPEPFKITASSHKVAESPKKKVHEFHARSVPKYIYGTPKLKNVEKHTLTTPLTPTFMKNYVKNSLKLNIKQEKQEESKDLKHTYKPSQTKIVPFSFELRDQHNRKKKEEMIKRVYEKEKEAREFHARPIPKSVLNTAKSSSLHRSSSSNTIQTNGRSNSEESLTVQFKARPASVLHKKPFEPKREERHLVEITEFQLNTEKRAKERNEFEKLKKEKEEKIESAKRMEEELQLKKGKEEIARIRREAEYKANPIKKYKELKIEPSGKVTTPISPKFLTDKFRKRENKENTSE